MKFVWMVAAAAVAMQTSVFAQPIPDAQPPARRPSAIPDVVVKPSDLRWAPFSLPGFCGAFEAAFVNDDTTRAPFIALLRMPKGSVLARHFHTRQIEAVYVLDGVMINDGQPLPAGSTLLHGPGVVHGPHTTDTGATLMFIQYGAVGPDDSVFVDRDGRVLADPPACTS